MLLQLLQQWFFEPLPPVQALYDYLMSQSWYMKTLMWAQIFSIVYHAFLTTACAMVELEILPGKQYKIRKDHETNASEIVKDTLLGLKNFVNSHLLPLLVFDYFFYEQKNPFSYYPVEAPSLWTSIWKLALYTLYFDFLTYYLHKICHYPLFGRWQEGTKWKKALQAHARKMHAAHHKHKIIYAWSSQVIEWSEGFSQIVFEEVAMLPFRMDPLTHLVGLFIMRYFSVEKHAGYDFPFLFANINPLGRYLFHGPVNHYFHHQNGKVNIENFFTLFDIIHGTFYIGDTKHGEFILHPLPPLDAKKRPLLPSDWKASIRSLLTIEMPPISL